MIESNKTTKFLFIIIVLIILIIIKNNLQSDDNILFTNMQETEMAIKDDNKILAYKPRPNFVDEKNGVYLNSFGFRDEEFSYNKSNQTFRIAIVGDSVTFGLYINDSSKMFSELLEFYLKDDNLEYEVYNFGIGGYSTLQETILINETVLEFKPDMIIIIYILNDIDEEVQFTIKNWFSEQEYYERRKVKEDLEQKSALCKIKSRLKNSNIYRGISVARNKFDNTETVQKYWQEVWNELYNDKCRTDGLKTTFTNLGIISQNNNIPILIVNHPYILWGETGYPQASINNMIRDFSEDNDFYFLDLTPNYLEYDFNEIRLANNPTDKYHPNELGHEIISTAIYNYLIEQEIIPVFEKIKLEDKQENFQPKTI